MDVVWWGMAAIDTIALPRHVLEALPALCRRFGVARLDLFGSAVTGRFDPDRSDFDFLVAFEGVRDHFFDLADALETLCGRRIDLLSERSIRNSYLREQVMEERVQLYPAA